MSYEECHKCINNVSGQCNNPDYDLCITSNTITSITVPVFLTITASLHRVNSVVNSSSHFENRPH